METKISSNKLKNIKKPKDFKMMAYPIQCIDKTNAVNGMMSLMKKSLCNKINVFYESIKNDYIMKFILNQYKLIYISVYILPYTSSNDYYTKTKSMEIIDKI